jgi:hypothetical protein
VRSGIVGLSLVCFAELVPLSAGAQTACPPSAPDGYHGGTSCTVTIDRNNPASPRTIVVRADTTVNIHLINARANEAIAFAPTTTGTPPVDVAATFLKSAITPLQSLVINQKTFLLTKSIELAGVVPPADPIATTLNALIDKLDDALGQMADASVLLSCLEGYRVRTGAAKSYFCTVAMLDSVTFPAAKNEAITSMLSAAKAPLPAASLQDVKKKIDDSVTASLALPVGNPTQTANRRAALAKDDVYLSTYNVLCAAITDTQKAQTTMLETAEQLSVLANAPPEATFPISRGKDYTATVTLVAQEVISKANVTVATVTINWQANQWAVSTGIMFSRLFSTTFSNGPLLVDGKPQFDAAGKVLTVVQQSDTRPTVMFPAVLASYRIRYLSRYNWENQCPNHCGVLVTGGVGLNLSTKTAEFAVGPSFQFGSLILTPGWHIGRQAELAQGVTVGAQFGSNPPNPLPTSTSWTAKFGLAFSYVLPFQ